MSLAKSTWNTIPGLKERKVWDVAYLVMVLSCLHGPWVQSLAPQNVKVVEQPWNQSTGVIRS